MPKMKTHSGAKKRFRITGTGKVMREQAGGRHRLEVKSSKEMRSIAGDLQLSKPDAQDLQACSASEPGPSDPEGEDWRGTGKRAVNAHKKRGDPRARQRLPRPAFAAVTARPRSRRFTR